MISPQIHVDWQVGEESYEAETAHVPRQRMDVRRATALIRGEAGVAQHLLRALFLLIVAILIEASHAPPLLQREALRVRDELEGTLALETLAWQRDYVPLLERLTDAEVDRRWQREWHSAWSVPGEERGDLQVFLTDVQLLNDALNSPQNRYVQANVQISDSLNAWWISSPYRERRFYQQIEEEWVRTLPADAFWGDARALQSEHLYFEYRAADADAVEAIAQRMDTVYLELHRTLGVEPVAELLTISVVPDLPQRSAVSPKEIGITSPTLSKVPASLSDAEYLAHQVASHITARAYERAVAGHSNLHLSRWQRMTWALRGWLRTEALAQRTPWHQQADRIFSARLAEQWPLHMRDLDDWNDSQMVSQEERMWQYAASESLLKYVADTYGIERIPALLDGFGQYPTWKELMPAVFDTAVEEFERSYNRYLAEKYELSPVLFAE